MVNSITDAFIAVHRNMAIILSLLGSVGFHLDLAINAMKHSDKEAAAILSKGPLEAVTASVENSASEAKSAAAILKKTLELIFAFGDSLAQRHGITTAQLNELKSTNQSLHVKLSNGTQQIAELKQDLNETLNRATETSQAFKEAVDAIDSGRIPSWFKAVFDGIVNVVKTILLQNNDLVCFWHCKKQERKPSPKVKIQVFSLYDRVAIRSYIVFRDAVKTIREHMNQGNVLGLEEQLELLLNSSSLFLISIMQTPRSEHTAEINETNVQFNDILNDLFAERPSKKLCNDSAAATKDCQKSTLSDMFATSSLNLRQDLSSALKIINDTMTAKMANATAENCYNTKNDTVIWTDVAYRTQLVYADTHFDDLRQTVISAPDKARITQAFDLKEVALKAFIESIGTSIRCPHFPIQDLLKETSATVLTVVTSRLNSTRHDLIATLTALETIQPSFAPDVIRHTDGFIGKAEIFLSAAEILFVQQNETDRPPYNASFNSFAEVEATRHRMLAMSDAINKIEGSLDNCIHAIQKNKEYMGEVIRTKFQVVKAELVLAMIFNATVTLKEVTSQWEQFMKYYNTMARMINEVIIPASVTLMNTDVGEQMEAGLHDMVWQPLILVKSLSSILGKMASRYEQFSENYLLPQYAWLTRVSDERDRAKQQAILDEIANEANTAMDLLKENAHKTFGDTKETIQQDIQLIVQKFPQLASSA